MHIQQRTDMDAASIYDLDDPTTLLLPSSFEANHNMSKGASLRQRWLKLWRCRVDLYHPMPKKRVTYRLVVFLPLLTLLAFALVV